MFDMQRDFKIMINEIQINYIIYYYIPTYLTTYLPATY